EHRDNSVEYEPVTPRTIAASDMPTMTGITWLKHFEPTSRLSLREFHAEGFLAVAADGIVGPNNDFFNAGRYFATADRARERLFGLMQVVKDPA
ncbi:MAG: hypothetical protein VW268_14110, partial [Rhodospirillaceae bacterium]